jgi:hypothetical protein
MEQVGVNRVNRLRFALFPDECVEALRSDISKTGQVHYLRYPKITNKIHPDDEMPIR